MRRLIRLWRDERGASSLVEYSIVLPLCLLVIFFIFLIGFYLQQKAIVESACERGLVVAMKMYNDPTSDSVYDFSSGTGMDTSGFGGKTYDFTRMKSDPYRYWGDYRAGDIKKKVESFVEAAITKSQLSVVNKWCGTPRATYSSNGGLLGKKIQVTVSQEYTIVPIVSLKLLGKATTTIKTTSYMNVVNQTEFIRNTDFVCDLLEQIGAGDIIAKISNALDKVTKFFSGDKK